ncbi:DUF3306 domain-containing protein [Bradyrhizobium sp. CB1717]|uniref:DUF3306 domain-containing protein n=1 Tax=Bradyrhizobium sp. CB1717 TaxID=3039154 RepID=UPI0024B23AA8|nr:DUF3306 domain-containing protein [Bradyrhizobium sp. CB1717]WFU23700.1 DUF3306 domain-containing protein [Bradyrhizobium sp. CB1717]
MSNDQNFLARWSRRKRGVASDQGKQSKQIDFSDDVTPEAASASVASGENRLPFDPASLPAIQSIGVESDIRAFLEARVPDDMARAALRRVWSLDPAIRDFVGLSENSWDFNAPGAIAGFGPIDGKDVGRLLSRLLEEPDTNIVSVHPPVISASTDDLPESADVSSPAGRHATTNAEALASVSPKAQASDFEEIDVSNEPARPGRDVAPKAELSPSEGLSQISRRGHGGALPQLRKKRTDTLDSE